jgi:serine protease Do
VVKNATRIEVYKIPLGEYNARIIQLDPTADLALLKIEDTSYHAFNGLPYGISKAGGELGEELFTLGYPRPEIVYNKGYLSAETGFRAIPLPSSSLSPPIPATAVPRCSITTARSSG